MLDRSSSTLSDGYKSRISFLLSVEKQWAEYLRISTMAIVFNLPNSLQLASSTQPSFTCRHYCKPPTYAASLFRNTIVEESC